MLGNGRLLHLQSVDNFADRALLEGEIVEYLAAAGLGDGVEGVGSGGGACHERYNTFLYGNMSSTIFGGPLPHALVALSILRVIFYEGTFWWVATLPLVEAHGAIHARRPASARSKLGGSPA